MRKSLILAIMVGLAVTGCSGATVFDADPTAAPTASTTPDVVPTETPEPTPTEMPIDEAAAYYLATVCPANVSLSELQAAFNNPASTIDDLNAAAASYQEVNVTAAMRLDDPAIIWPAAIQEDIDVIAAQMRLYVTFTDELIAAPTIEEMFQIEPTIIPGAREVGPRVREALNISLDAIQTCSR